MKKTVRIIAIITMAVAAVFAAGATDLLYGNAAAKADNDLTIQDMLLYAAQDEYLARAEYVAIMAKFGTARPFSNIKESEETHLEWLAGAYKTYNIAFPADDSKSFLIIPSTLKEAYETGVKAEIDNIAMYDKFLSTSLIKSGKYEDLKTLFTNLRNASENHLSAFQNQLSKY